MRVWLLEVGTDWDLMTTTGVFRREKTGLKVYTGILRDEGSKRGHKIQHITTEDGSHVSAWGVHRLRLRPVRPL